MEWMSGELHTAYAQPLRHRVMTALYVIYSAIPSNDIFGTEVSGLSTLTSKNSRLFTLLSWQHMTLVSQILIVG